MFKKYRFGFGSIKFFHTFGSNFEPKIMKYGLLRRKNCCNRQENWQRRVWIEFSDYEKDETMPGVAVPEKSAPLVAEVKGQPLTLVVVVRFAVIMSMLFF